MDIIKSHDRTRSPSYGAIISDFFEKFVKRNYNSSQHYNFSLNYPEVILYNKFIIYRIKPPGTKDSLYPPVVTVFSYYFYVLYIQYICKRNAGVLDENVILKY